MALRKSEGKHMGRRKGSGEKIRILNDNKNEILRLLKTDRPLVEICRDYKISYDTFYRFRNNDPEIALALKIRKR